MPKIKNLVYKIAYILNYLRVARGVTTDAPDLSRECQKIEGSVCRGLGYNFTLFPNLLKHETQLDALKELQQYYPLISIQCSSYLREFLCALYFPPCTEYFFHLPPCRSLCLKARRGCEKLQEFPSKFDCDNFPKSQELMCHPPQDDVTDYNAAVKAKLFTELRTEQPFQSPPLATPAGPTNLFDFRSFGCSNDSHCISGSKCRGGECVCMYPRAWGPLGCQMTQILGGSCSHTSECTAVTPNSICRDSICSCVRSLTNYRNLSCIHGSEYGSLCYNDAQCKAVNKFSFCRFLVAHVVGTCACDPDQFLDEDGKCVPRLGGRCEKGPCPKELGKATCKKSPDGEYRCRCMKRALQESGVCLRIAKQVEEKQFDTDTN